MLPSIQKWVSFQFLLMSYSPRPLRQEESNLKRFVIICDY